MIRIEYVRKEDGAVLEQEYETFKEAVARIDREKDYGWEPAEIFESITETTLRRRAAHD